MPKGSAIKSKKQWRKLARLAFSKNLRKGEHRLSPAKFHEMTEETSTPFANLPNKIRDKKARKIASKIVRSKWRKTKKRR